MAVKLNGFRRNTTGSLETMASDKLRDYLAKGLLAEEVERTPRSSATQKRASKVHVVRMKLNLMSY